MSKLRVLIADDDPIIRLDLKQMLQNLDYEVVAEAGDGQEAVDLARALKPDICVLDIKMPVKDGIEAVSEIVGECIAPAILLTAYGDRELVDRARDAGAFGYLVKPFKPSDLPPAIEVAVARYEQLCGLQDEVGDLKDRLETRKLVERAKGILIEKQGLSETEAYRRIQQSSMNSRKSMREVAEAIILTETL
ncbi:MAG: response regulator [Armatimonadetes bacterium]|nr:response regulator [Armatimonadota bacterium]